MTRRAALGPWFKLYADVVERKAHYSDAQFRAFVEVLAWGVRNSPRGTLPSRRSVTARLGSEAVDFMFTEGDLVEEADGSVTISGWDVYQSGVLSTERKAPKVANPVEHVDNSSRTVPEPFTNIGPLPSTSSSTEEEDGAVAVNGGAPVGDRDSLDRFHELTNVRPWGRPSGRWLRDLEEQHGLVNVVAALEVEARSGDTKDLIGRVAGRLGKQAERIERQAERARKAPPRPSPEEEAMRAAMVATGRYEPPVNGSRGGPLTKVGDLLQSAPDGSASQSTSPVSAEGRRSDPAADRVEANSFAPHRDRHSDAAVLHPDGQG